MPRSLPISALLAVGTCLRLDPHQQGSEQTAFPEKKITGPEQRHCRRPKTRNCEGVGCRNSQNIVGGTVVNDPTEFPFLAWIGDNDGTLMGQFCGGTLVSDRIVLTAGHCLYNSDAKNAQMWVRLRLANFADSPGVARNVINWRRHPDYSTTTLHNDLTLLLLNESVPEDLARPVPISDGARPFEHEGEKVVVGWGSTDEQCSVYDALLRRAPVPLGTGDPRCGTVGSKILTPKTDFDNETQCCAGDYSEGAMRYPGCGDSGGPLLAMEDGTWHQVGMVSWSYGRPWPDVFTRVSHFAGWIASASRLLLSAGAHPAARPAAR